MQAHPIPPFDNSDTPDGICTVDGWGVKISVHKGHLVIEDGVGRSRRTRRYHKATSGLRRLVILGHSGFITFEAARWLADAKIQVIHLDYEGRILSVSAQAPNLPALRRSQAQALSSPVGLEVVRDLLTLKVGGQIEVANRLGGPDPEVNVALGVIGVASDIDALRIAEARAAFAYWRLWADVPMRFTRADSDSVPEHWLTFGVRGSTQSGSARRAINPINALLNYLYRLLEAEARIAAIAVGLDPGLGILHLDTPSRDSFALDLMEAGRPAVDSYVLDLLEGHLFRSSDFIETRAGGCRIAPRLAHHLTNTTTLWAQHLAEPAEQVALRLASRTRGTRSAVPTPLTQANRRKAQGNSWAVTKPQIPRLRRCRVCEEPLESPGSLCDACRAKAKDESEWDAAGRSHLAELRAQGEDPAHGGAAGGKRARKVSRENRRSADWDLANSERPPPDVFTDEILPGLQLLTLREMSEATGLSIDYCSKIRRGLKVPHPRHWARLRNVT